MSEATRSNWSTRPVSEQLVLLLLYAVGSPMSMLPASAGTANTKKKKKASKSAKAAEPAGGRAFDTREVLAVWDRAYGLIFPEVIMKTTVVGPGRLDLWTRSSESEFMPCRAIGFQELSRWASGARVNAPYAPSWFARVVDEDRRERYQRAIHFLFFEVNALLTGGKFSEVDAWIASLDPAELSDHLVVGVLSITKAAAEKLVWRSKFLDDCRAAAIAKGKDAERLLGGLQGRRLKNGEAS
jgi:hypothetical protein